MRRAGTMYFLPVSPRTSCHPRLTSPSRLLTYTPYSHHLIVERAIRAVVSEFEAAARPLALTDATLFAIKARTIEITADLAQRFAAARVVRP